MEIKEMIERYLSGEATPEETAQVTAFLADDQSDLSLLQDIFKSFPENKAVLGDMRARDSLLLQLRQQLYPQLAGDLEHVIPHSNHMRPVSLQWKWWAGVAASLMLLFSAWWLMEYLRRDKTITAPALVWQSVENNTDRVRAYRLPDGSSLWLHPHSRLRYPAYFEQSAERIVRLEGEGFFDVAHHSSRPFIIQTGRIQTRVLGTAFNIEAYDNEDIIRVSLVRGKVSVTGTATDHTTYTTLLSAGHILVHNKQQQANLIDTLMATHSSQWTDGTMVLNNIPIKDALQRVARRYGIQLVYAQNIDLEEKNVNGVFKEQTLEEMLRIILFVSGYQYRLTNETIEIYKK